MRIRTHHYRWLVTNRVCTACRWTETEDWLEDVVQREDSEECPVDMSNTIYDINVTNKAVRQNDCHMKKAVAPPTQ